MGKIQATNQVYKVVSENNVNRIVIENETIDITAQHIISKEIVSLANGFVSASFQSGDTTIEIGTIPIGVKIINTIVDVTTAGGGTLTVGNDSYNAILQTVNDNDLNNVNSYITFNNYLNPIGQTYKGYFNGNLSAGTITIYYN